MQDLPPADWFPDPFGRYHRRYWNGTAWTEHVASLEGLRGEDPPVDRAPATPASQAAASWHPDPFGRHEIRYWDGSRWTEHVASHGRQNIDPPTVQQTAPQPSPAVSPDPPPVTQGNRKVKRQVQKVGMTGPAVRDADNALFTEPVLVINQRGKVVEINAEYAIYDQHGRQIAAAREVGQSVMKSAVTPSNRTRRLHVSDMNGTLILSLTQPMKMINSKMIVRSADGTQIGQITEKLTLTYARFRLESNGQALGSISGENRRESDFSIQDAAGNEIGRITRTRTGIAKQLLTKADNYVVEITRPLDEPLRSLVIAAALAVDTALRQR